MKNISEYVNDRGNSLESILEILQRHEDMLLKLCGDDLSIHQDKISQDIYNTIASNPNECWTARRILEEMGELYKNTSIQTIFRKLHQLTASHILEENLTREGNIGRPSRTYKIKSQI